MKRFPFEDISLILHRNCNLKCSYCPLDHFEEKMENSLLESIMKNLLIYDGYQIHITLFGGEALLNPGAFRFLQEFFTENTFLLQERNIKFVLKIVTNGVLINDEYIKIFNFFHSHPNITFEINVSIDGKRETQVSQRPMRNSQFDYFDILEENIGKLIENNLPFSFGLVMAFEKDDFIEDINYLWDKYKIPLFIMPVDLEYNYIRNTPAFFAKAKRYMLAVHKTITYFRTPERKHRILNLTNRDFWDIKTPPIGPTFGHDGKVYISRDYLFTMDKEAQGIQPIFEYPDSCTMDEIFEYFYNNPISELERFGMKKYFGRTIIVNKKIGNFFTRLIYPRNSL